MMTSLVSPEASKQAINTTNDPSWPLPSAHAHWSVPYWVLLPGPRQRPGVPIPRILSCIPLCLCPSSISIREFPVGNPPISEMSWQGHKWQIIPFGSYKANIPWPIKPLTLTSFRLWYLWVMTQLIMRRGPTSPNLINVLAYVLMEPRTLREFAPMTAGLLSVTMWLSEEILLFWTGSFPLKIYWVQMYSKAFKQLMRASYYFMECRDLGVIHLSAERMVDSMG